MTTPQPRDPELALSLAYAPADARAGLAALWALDERLASVVVEPNRAIAAIKLAWWREALERLDTAPPPPEPLLAALAREVVAQGVSGARLSMVAEAWDTLIDDAEEGADARSRRHVAARAAALFAAAADLLGGAGETDVATAGELWAAATVPAGFAPPADRTSDLARLPRRWPRRLRSLGVLAVLGQARLRQPSARAASPGRLARALWLGLSGR